MNFDLNYGCSEASAGTSSAECQKGVKAVQWEFVENQKGANSNTIDFVQR